MGPRAYVPFPDSAIFRRHRPQSIILGPMDPAPRSRSLALVLSVLPGWGHVYWGREFFGLFLFTLFTICAFAIVNGLLLDLGRWKAALVWGGAAGAAGCAAWAWTDILRRTSPARLREEASLRERQLKEGMLAYVRGDHEAAKKLFFECARRDPSDVEALFRLGMAYARAGEREAAIRWLERTRRRDFQGKWAWEIRVELARLRSGGSSAEKAGAAKPSPSAKARNAAGGLEGGKA